MKWRIHTIGKPALAYAKSGVAEYEKRLSRYTKLDVSHGKERGRAENGAQLLSASDGSLRVVLDERGQDVGTKTLVSKINGWEQDGSIKTISVLIGGADGHNEEVRSSADELWRLSALTLQHELALVVLLEAIYRAYTIKRGEPYHRV